MTPLEAALRLAVEALRKEGVRWAVVGGLAVSARAEPRTTRDVDVAVGVVDDAEAERILFRLQGHGLVVVSVVEQTARKRLATARLRPADEAPHGLLLDLLFASSGIEEEIVASADEIEVLPGLTIPIARTGHLVALKALARNDRDRPQDLDDIRALRGLVVAPCEAMVPLSENDWAMPWDAVLAPDRDGGKAPRVRSRPLTPPRAPAPRPTAGPLSPRSRTKGARALR